MSGSKSSDPGARRVPSPDAAMPNREEQALNLTVHDIPRGHASAADEATDTSRRRWGRFKMTLVLLACAAPVIASYLSYFVIRPEGRTNYATLLSPTREWPAALALRDNAGAAVNPAAFKRQWLLVSMGSGTCDAACESRLYTQRQMREMLGRERDRLDKLFIVLDATPLQPALQAAVDAAPPTRVLRATRVDVAAWLGVDAPQVDQHLYLVDPMGQWMMKAPVNPEPAKLKRDLDRLMRASAFWDKAGR